MLLRVMYRDQRGIQAPGWTIGRLDMITGWRFWWLDKQKYVEKPVEDFVGGTGFH